MRKTNDYSDFKQLCNGFKEIFTDRFFATEGLFCHPLVEGLIIAPCSEEEARSNGPDICRVSDMLLMSADGNEYVPFVLAEARKIAEDQGNVWISSVLYDIAFKSECWMIDGKHDTVIISEEHMKKEGKPYAPVTPLTNVRLPFKKFNNAFLYQKGTIEEPAIVTQDDISENLNDYLSTLLEDFVSLEAVSSAEFEVGDNTVITDVNESRCNELDKALAMVDSLREHLTKNADAFALASYKVDLTGFTIRLLMKAMDKCGVSMKAGEFRSEYIKVDAPDSEYLKSAFRKALSDKNSYGFKYEEVNAKEYNDNLHKAELSTLVGKELVADLMELIKVRPASATAYALLKMSAQGSAEDVEAIAKYWGVKIPTNENIADEIAKSYVPDSARDEEGKIACSVAEAKIILENVTVASSKYKIKDMPIAAELKALIDDADKAERTYNGTVFATKDEMAKAMSSAIEINELCEDLTSMKYDELIKLRKYIYDMTIDKKTKAKQLVRIKVAMNDCEKNQLENICLGASTKKVDELEAVIEKLNKAEVDETIKKPYLAQVKGYILSAQLDELTEKFSKTSDPDELEKIISDEKYDSMFKKHFTAKIDAIRDKNAKGEIEKICVGIDKADEKTLFELKDKLSEFKCRESLKAPYLKAIEKRFSDIELEEVKKTFANIDKADKAKCEELKKIITDGKFRKTLTEPYAKEIEKREAEIALNEFKAECDTIPKMDKAKLDEIKAKLTAGEYEEEMVKKYSDMIDARELVLKKEEVAELTKDIAKLDFDKLDELEKTLSDEKYPKEITEESFKKIEERRKTLTIAKIDEKCKDVAKLDKEALLKLKEELIKEEYPEDYTKKHFEAIEKREVELEKQAADKMCKGMENMKKADLEKLEEELKNSEFSEATKNAYLEKVRALEIKQMKLELEKLCANIPTMPREELSKLKEALTGEGFDAELSKKYIEQIDKRISELVKKEVSEISKNIANSPKAKLLEMKKKLEETPEYETEAKPYLEQINKRIKDINKEEFDKQMKSIDTLSAEELSDFLDELEERKATMDEHQYDACMSKCEARGRDLENAELTKLCDGVEKMSIAELQDVKDKISDGTFTPEYTYSFIKKIEDALSDRFVRHFTKLLENVQTMKKAELIVLKEKILENKIGCPEDMLTRYIGKLNNRMREVDDSALAFKCKELKAYNETMTYELIKDIRDMDIDDDVRKKYITQAELHITHIKKSERDRYVDVIRKTIKEINYPEAKLYADGISKAFETQYIAICKTFASVDQFEMPIIIYETVAGKPDEAFMLTGDYLYYKGRNGFGRVDVEKLDKVEGKKALIGAASLTAIERDGTQDHLPIENDKKTVEGMARILNDLLDVMSTDRANIKLTEAADRKKMADMKQLEFEEEQKAIAKAREEAESKEEDILNAKPVEEKSAEEKAAEEKAAEKAAEPIKPIKQIKPIDVVISPIPEVKQIKPLTDDASSEKADDKKADEKKEEKPAEPMADELGAEQWGVAKAAEKKADEKPAEEKKPEDKKADEKADDKKEEKPAEKKAAKFCEDCGAKIESETAKFCAECGHKLI